MTYVWAPVLLVEPDGEVEEESVENQEISRRSDTNPWIAPDGDAIATLYVGVRLALLA